MNRPALVALLVSSAAWAGSGEWVKQKGVVHFIVEGPFDDVHGETHQLGGVLELDPDDWVKASGAVAVELATLRTGIDQRDEDMRTEFLQVARFPSAILTIDRIERPSQPAVAPGANVKGEAHGTFEVHGVRRKVAFTVNVHREGDERLRASGSFDVPFADYGVQRPSRLFLKLGENARVIFDVTFSKVPEASPVPPPVQPTVAQVLPAAPTPKPPQKKKPRAAPQVKYFFTSGDAKSRGEKLFHSPGAGGEGNKMTCFHCHAKTDDRDLKDGHVRAARTLANSSQRDTFWNGFATDPVAASAICQKQFMLGQGFTKEQSEDLLAFLDAISPQKTPPLDYAVNYQSMETLLQDPIGGNARSGQKLADKYCMTCHLDGRVGPVWAPGLYEPDWVVRRVRRLEGHQNRQMPGWSQARLADGDLRDIVTYLTGPQTGAPIFKRVRSAGAPVRAGSR